MKPDTKSVQIESTVPPPDGRDPVILGAVASAYIALCSLLALLLEVPYLLLPGEVVTPGHEFQHVIRAMLVVAVVCLPFDILGARHHHRHCKPPADREEGEAVRKLARGIMVHTLWLIVAAMLILQAGKAYGVPGAVVVAAFLVLTLAFNQHYFSHTAGRMMRDADASATAAQTSKEANVSSYPVDVVTSDDPGFSGGISGLKGMERIIIPKRWLDTQQKQMVADQIKQRIAFVRSGERSTAMIIAGLAVVFSFAVAALLPGSGVDTVAGVVTLGCWMSLITGFAYATAVVAGTVIPASFNRRSTLEHAFKLHVFYAWGGLYFGSRLAPQNVGRPELYVIS